MSCKKNRCVDRKKYQWCGLGLSHQVACLIMKKRHAACVYVEEKASTASHLYVNKADVRRSHSCLWADRVVLCGQMLTDKWFTASSHISPTPQSNAGTKREIKKKNIFFKAWNNRIYDLFKRSQGTSRRHQTIGPWLVTTVESVKMTERERLEEEMVLNPKHLECGVYSQGEREREIPQRLKAQQRSLSEEYKEEEQERSNR